jgi:hypothetical protein
VHKALKANNRKRHGRSDQHPIVSIPNIHRPFERLGLHIHDGEGRPVDRDRGQNLVVLLDVDDAGPIRRVVPGPRGHGIRKGHRAKVGKRNEVAVTIFEIFNDPLCILPAKRISRGELRGPGLAIGEILDRGDTRRRGIRSDSGSNDVPGGDLEVGEIVRPVGVPLVPCCSQKG